MVGCRGSEGWDLSAEGLVQAEGRSGRSHEAELGTQAEKRCSAGMWGQIVL